jgi:trans-aconitate 2-methyltransferase
VTRSWDAASYDRISDPMLRMGSDVLDRLPLRGDERALDAGCGSGRVTERLAERLPHGRVIALDASPAMIARAAARLGRFGHQVELMVADLGRPLPVEPPVDAVLSTATFHWVPDHDALFRNLAGVMRPGARLAAQCGGAGNLASVQQVLRDLGEDPLAGVHFETPEATDARLRAAGFSEVRCWLVEERVALERGGPLEEYLRTIVLGAHLDGRSGADAGRFVRAVAEGLAEPVLDYVRLNIDAVRADGLGLRSGGVYH